MLSAPSSIVPILAELQGTFIMDDELLKSQPAEIELQVPPNIQSADLPDQSDDEPIKPSAAAVVGFANCSPLLIVALIAVVFGGAFQFGFSIGRLHKVP